MSKIDELIESKVDPHVFKINGYEALSDVMKEYAEWYARKCLEKFEKDGVSVYDMQGDFLGYSTPYLETFKLPEHE
jgi:CO dehydrogenase/acetyl-CoA synthase delta subunit